LEREEISVFYINVMYKSSDCHANAIVVHPQRNSIYYIEPSVYDDDDGINIHILDRLKTIVNHHSGREWDLLYNAKIQGDDSFCASWVQICIGMIIANPHVDGIMLIMSLMSHRTYPLRYTILILWLYYMRKKLTEGARTVEYYINPENKDTVMGEYKEYYPNFMDEEIEEQYNDDIPLMEQVLEELDKDYTIDSMFLLNEDNIQLPKIN